MRKGSFYPHLALVNLVRNGQFYLPYLLSCGGTACMFYIISYLAYSEIVSGVRGAAYLQMLMVLGIIVVALFSAIILLYANNFVMKRRQRELGLYNVLGMEKRHIAHLMFWETLMCALVSILGGIASGILLSKLILLLLLRIVHLPVVFGFEISGAAIVHTAVLFGILFALTLLVNLVRLGRSKPIELLRSENAGEKEPRVKWPLVVIGLATLLGGYYIALTVKNPIDAMVLFFVAVLLVIIGTYCLFTAGSIAVLKAMRRNKGFYYDPRHFTAVSGMLYRMKQNAVGLANICILATMVLVTVSTTVSLYLGLGAMTDQMYPTDLQVRQRIAPLHEGETARDPAVLLAQVQAIVDGEGRTMSDFSHYTYTQVYALYSGNTFLFDTDTGGDYNRMFLMTAAEYTALTGQTVSLAPDEALVYSSLGTIPNTFYIEEMPFQVAGRLDTFLDYSNAVYSDIGNVGLVVADDRVLSAITALNTESPLAYFAVYFNLDGTDEEKLACAEALIANDSEYNVISRQNDLADFYAIYGGFLFLGIFLGILFLTATVLIIYYKQVSEGYEDRKRFTIMQQVGMSRREVRQSINAQVLLVFFLPLAVAALHILVAFPMIQKMLLLFSLTNVKLFILCTIGTLLVFSAIYALVYSATARTYYKIVRTQEGS